MQYDTIVKEHRLDSHSDDLLEAKGLLPELVLHLIKASVPEHKELRVPVRSSIGQPGWDVVLDTPARFSQFVPAGKSYWEIGVGRPQKKATEDFKKRTTGAGKISLAEQKQATFVFVTSRSALRTTWTDAKQKRWIASRKKTSKWKDIRIIDATLLAQWLMNFPGIDRWLANEMRLPVKGVTTPAMHWLTVQEFGSPPLLKPGVFVKSRLVAVEKLKAVLTGDQQVLMVGTRYPNELADFIAATLAYIEQTEGIDYSARCLLIDDIDTWRTMCALDERHVLVASPKLDLESETNLIMEAKRGKHAVIYPGSPRPTGHGNSVLLQEHTSHDMQTGLEDCGYSPELARLISLQSNGRLTIMKRLLVGVSASPDWADISVAGELARLVLVGAFIDEGKDVGIVGEIVGKDMGEWTSKMRPLTMVVDPPLIHLSGRWKFVSRYEGWTWLGRHLVDDDLRKFAEQTLIVLRELDKRLDLDKEERSLAVSTKENLHFSRLLRHGLSEGLALLGSHDEVLQSCSPNAGPITAARVVRELLSDGSWKLWCSLNDVMPLLAEAAPDEFLDAVETHLKFDEGALFKSLFDQETSGFFGATYMTGLLWALETLSWHSDYLTRTTLVLGKLADLDPGGNWANRPASSLTNIFLPWLPQTLASIEQRTNAVSVLVDKVPNVSWNLLMSLLPRQSTTSSGSHKPVWRELIPEDFQRNVPITEYWDQVSKYSGIVVGIVKKDHERAIQLIDMLDQIMPDGIAAFLTYLESDEVQSLADEQRLSIWERLFALSLMQRRFPERDGLLSASDLKRVDRLIANLQPSKASMRNQRLFGEREFEVMEDVRGKFDEQRRELDARRHVATAEILAQEGIEVLIQFAGSVHHSGQVGVALGNLPEVDLDASLLPRYLNHGEKGVQHFIGGYAWAKYWRLGWAWIDALDIASWSAEQAATFFAGLPFNKGTWVRAEARLGDQATAYWQSLVNINPYHATEDIFEATRLLLKHERARLALDCLGRARHNEQLIPSDLIADVLIANLRSTEPLGSMLQHEIVELIGALQKHPEKDLGQLRSIELAYLSMLEYGSSGSPLFLDRGLSEDPRFFCEVISLVYKPEGHEGTEPEVPTDTQRNLAERAFRLLHRWKLSPGSKDDQSFDPEAFETWVAGVKSVAAQTGHLAPALRQVGQVVAHLPVSKDGLGIPEVVARFLEEEDDDYVRRSFSNGLYNKRGTQSVTGGLGEHHLATYYADWAARVDSAGLVRLAKTLRDLSRTYEHEAKEEEARAVLEKEGLR